MSWIVLDASVALSWCFPDEQTPAAMSVLDSLKAGDQALVPAFWCSEVLNSLLVGERKGRISPDQTRAFLNDLSAMRPVLDDAPFSGCSKTFRHFAANMAWPPTTRFTWNWLCGRGVRLRRWIRIKKTLP